MKWEAPYDFYMWARRNDSHLHAGIDQIDCVLHANNDDQIMSVGKSFDKSVQELRFLAKARFTLRRLGRLLPTFGGTLAPVGLRRWKFTIVGERRN